MAQYLLSVHAVEGEPELTDEQSVRMHDDVMAFHDRLRQQGAFVFGGGLYPAEEATVVRSEDGKTAATDGPFAERTSQLGGFWIVEAPDLAAAQALAAVGSAARRGTPVEVRQFHEIPDDE